MEVMQIPGYTPNEKLQIAKQYLSKKAVRNNGLENYTLNIKDESLDSIISHYTKESGVRELERTINTVARKIATDVVTKEHKEGKRFTINATQLEKL